MPVVRVEPTDEYPSPYSLEDETAATFLDDISVTATTAELLEQLSPPPEVTPEDLKRETTLVEEAIRTQNASALRSPLAATAARSFLQQYGQALAMDVVQVRMALTNKLMELANCGEPKFELKALELLGKHSDIGLFTQRSEINISYNNPESLEKAIKERVKRLLNADIVDVTPLGTDLDDELGVAEPEPDLPPVPGLDYDEVEDGDD
jgi:hypothetical protein